MASTACATARRSKSSIVRRAPGRRPRPAAGSSKAAAAPRPDRPRRGQHHRRRHDQAGAGEGSAAPNAAATPAKRDGGRGRKGRADDRRNDAERAARRRDDPAPGDRRGDDTRRGAMTMRRFRGGAVNPSRLFIDRPVATSLLMIAILLVGIVAFRFLPLSALPEVDYPTIQVQTFYPGASPEVMTSSVTAPLERQFGQMPSLSQMMSQSSAGASVITLQFGLDLSLDIAEQEVQAAINAAGNLLPADLPAPPIYAKVNPAMRRS